MKILFKINNIVILLMSIFNPKTECFSCGNCGCDVEEQLFCNALCSLRPNDPKNLRCPYVVCSKCKYCVMCEQHIFDDKKRLNKYLNNKNLCYRDEQIQQLTNFMKNLYRIEL
jgi:hypothetical protein